MLLVRVPKSLALLEDQLLRLAPAVHAGTVVVGTGMVKEIHTSTLQLFERILGPTRTSLAEKKARLIFCTPDPSLEAARQPRGRTATTLPDDVGAALRAVPSSTTRASSAPTGSTSAPGSSSSTCRRAGGAQRVVDLGCGNGVVGTAVALANPEAEVLFIDESFQAVASAEATYKANGRAGARRVPGRGRAGGGRGRAVSTSC